MNNHIPISWLNDYVFCPYYIYLHNVYTGTEITLKIETQFKKHFTGSDSVLIFSTQNDNVIKLGNAIHRDTDLLIL